MRLFPTKEALQDFGEEMDKRVLYCKITKQPKNINQTLGMLYTLRELLGVDVSEEFHDLCEILREVEK